VSQNPTERWTAAQVLAWVKTEITAGMVLRSRDGLGRTWNEAHRRAIGIIESYEGGEGLFQMTDRGEREPLPLRTAPPHPGPLPPGEGDRQAAGRAPMLKPRKGGGQ
jgi:hypothetical protein